MFLFACTFPGLATKYIETATEAEAREKAWAELIESNDAPESYALVVTKIN